MIHYILQTLAFQLLFLLVYDLFLKRETFFNYNRLYLIVAPIVSFILPFIKINALREQIPADYIVQLPAVLLGGTSVSSETSTIMTMASESISMLQIVVWIWMAGVVVSIFIFGIKLFRIIKLKQLGIKKSCDGIPFFELPQTDTAFTFVKTIFVGAELSATQQKNILLHEQVHVKENHFADLLFFELLRIVCWFNPLVYIFQQRVSLLQEYKADAVVMKQQSKQEYYQNLLAQVFSVEYISFINTFFNHSLLKKRIIMLQKTKSKSIFQLKYLLLVPVVFGMLLYSSCANEGTKEVAEDDTEVMQKINELSEAIMKKGNLTEEEEKALQFLSTEGKPGGKVYKPVQDYLDETEGKSSDVPFASLDNAPVFPGCEGLEGAESKKCFQESVSTFVAENFPIKELEESSDVAAGKHKIVVEFVIDEYGYLKTKNIRTNDPTLELASEMMLKKFPAVEPGMHERKKVSVFYTLPIIFELNE